jgi:hypothetical protein
VFFLPNGYFPSDLQKVFRQASRQDLKIYSVVGIVALGEIACCEIALVEIS